MTQNRLKELLDYNGLTGEFVRLLKIGRGRKANVGDTVGYHEKNNSITIRIDNTKYRAHQLVWLYVYGYIPREIDHINQDRSDNSLKNLREVSHAENMKNRPKYVNNKSGVTGVHLTVSGKYKALIRVSGKLIHLGLFEDKAKAVKARQEAEVLYGFHVNHGR